MPKRPPLGIKPRMIHDIQRYWELKDTILRYLKDDREPNDEWLVELLEIHGKYTPHQLNTCV